MAAINAAERTLAAEGYNNVTLLCPDRLEGYQRETSYLGAFALREFLGGGGASGGAGGLGAFLAV